ncbi:hypothetical protein HanRHA438_Chr10g0448051 [Helianthus annuus]|nr:hypothetical protein HanRHA438_Chr10g0448051 [Helianthus annuus]KAJ0883395.1 hypothetical protein HanPSC8_Chr10g0421011 [Helianthus annuus]
MAFLGGIRFSLGVFALNTGVTQKLSLNGVSWSLILGSFTNHSTQLHLHNPNSSRIVTIIIFHNHHPPNPSSSNHHSFHHHHPPTP